MFEFCSLAPNERLTISEAARFAGVCLPTIYRWLGKGVKGHKLKTFTIGKRRFVSKSAMAEFVRATNTHDAPAVVKVPNNRYAQSVRQAQELGIA